MERTEVLDMMGSLKLYGMRSAYDETLATALKRKHEPQRFVGDLLKAEISEKQARSIKYQLTVAKLPLAKDVDDFAFKNTPIKRLSCATRQRQLPRPTAQLVLVWGTGTGKTHLAIAIARSCIRAGLRGRRPTNTTARWPRPSRLSANSISPNSRASRTPTRLRTRLTFQRRTLQASQRIAPERFPDAWPHHRRYPARPRFTPEGSRVAPRATLRQPRGGRVATRGSPLWTPGRRPLPMIKRGPFSMPMGVPFSTPIDTRSALHRPIRGALRVL